MTIFSGFIGFFALLGGWAAIRWAFGGEGDHRPIVDLLFERIRSRRFTLPRAGSAGTESALYPPSGWTACDNPECGKLARGAHSCSAPTPSNVAEFKRRAS